MSMHKFAVLLVAAALVAGCATKPTADEEAARVAGERDGRFATQPLPGDDDDLFGNGAPRQRQDGTGDPADAATSQSIIYFDFDSSSIRSEYNQSMAEHAAYLVANSGTRVRLEGHTDERGSREYNIGLGERRAQAVRRALMLQGVRGEQIATVSLGEERPAVAGSDEEALAMNRRVEIVYLR
jgi:peptidoglycan-associated lipoprotein